MKKIIPLIAALLIFAECKKENNSIKPLSATDKNSTEALTTDIDGVASNPTVTIGTQKWMILNLNVSRYRNGDKIPQVKNTAKWAALTTGAWCYYNNDSANATYGKLYNWYAVNDPRGLAPVGFHVPNDTEWATLSTFLGTDALAGGAMKSTGTIEEGTGLWHYPNNFATNSSGFTALPGAYRFNDGTFYDLGNGYLSYFWSSTYGDPGRANYRNLWYYNSWFFSGGIDSMSAGKSVRCLRD